MMQCSTSPVTLNADNPLSVMKRYELKYIIDEKQTDYLLDSLKGRIKPDQFGLTTISSLYYDTPDSLLIRTSVEKPGFKEKIRLRSYGPATVSSPVFLELKRKAYGVVYKRRVKATIPAAEDFFAYRGALPSGQIGREITSFRDHYVTLVPSCLVMYDRTAYFEPGGDLRLTIDRDPRFRTDALDLTLPAEGASLLPPGCSVLELKVQDAIPLWLSGILANGGIYKTSFSKYGEAYRRTLFKI